jgi:sodium-dependent phosphate cotransporter
MDVPQTPPKTKVDQAEISTTSPESNKTASTIDSTKELTKSTPSKPILYERILGDKPAPVRYFCNFLCICALLYLFLIGLDLMGNAFKAMSGKGVGNMLGSIDNPIAGVAIGIIVTVLLQSSSTSTSIVVTMVGADIITVTNAIPIIMGANIGTSVTAAIVSHGHMGNLEEFHRGFAGANVHSAFNLLTVIILLPLELISAAISGSNGILGSIAESLGDLLVGASADTFKSPVKILVGPLTKEFIKIDKDLIKTLAKGCLSCNATHVEPMFCKAEKKDKETGDKIKFCLTGEDWTQKYEEDGRIIKSGFAKDLGDEGGAVLILVLSLVFLCIALYYIVKLLHYLVLSSGRAEGDGDQETKFVRITRKVLRANGCVSILFGMVMTIAVQSSSIVTATLTPVVALGIISVEDMLPLTLGANIGTTCTAFLAAIVTEKKNAIMISLAHLFFNIFGIAIFYPAPFMRRIPIKIAYRVGDHVLKHKWFGPFYICLVFIVVPLLLFLCSLALDLGVGGIILNVIFDTAIVIGAFVLVDKFDHIVTAITKGRSAQSQQEQASV